MNHPNQKLVFLLGGQRMEIDFSRPQAWTPDTTVLQFLRSLPGRSGTKEGCAEGDCGACTVVVAEPDGQGGLRHAAIDSCILLLPMLHGKQLLTVEDIGRPERLHPVQQAMVDCDGSQCGYCTPGFVMSLFALYQQPSTLGKDDVLDGLTGNLCRCTGYRSILDAAEQACRHRSPDAFSADAPAVCATLEAIRAEFPRLDVGGPGHTYHRPSTLREALEIRAAQPGLPLVSGATDLALKVTKQKQPLPALLDLSGIAELKAISDDGQAVTFGAGASLEAVKGEARKAFPALHQMLAVFGSRQIREQGTLGGNIANASPIGDTPPVLMALDASVELASIHGTRRMPLTAFITGYRSTDLRPDEVIARVVVPHTPAGVQVRAYKVSKRKDLDISTVSGGFRLVLSADGTVAEIALYYGGMDARTRRAAKAEAFLLGKPWTQAHAEAAMPLIDEEFTPISDARSGKEGRRLMARNLLLKFWSDTAPVPHTMPQA